VYLPRHFAADEALADELIAGALVELISPTRDGRLIATALPMLRVGDSLLGHMARANPHWREAGDGESLAIARGPDGYVSPSWYPSKAEHGQAVPTWNYQSAHAHGQLVAHDDPAWVRPVVAALTRRHEAGRAEPWDIGDAPADWLDGQLRAIVGVELRITRVEAKAKLSQNRSAADALGVIDGLGGGPLASAMRAALAARQPGPEHR